MLCSVDGTHSILHVGDIVENIRKLVNILGWKADLEALIKKEKHLWEVRII